MIGYANCDVTVLAGQLSFQEIRSQKEKRCFVAQEQLVY